MIPYLKSIASVTGPLTLIAFLAVIFLAAYRHTVIQGKGLDYLYNLLKDKTTKKDFYQLAMRVINLVFILLVVITALSLASWIIGKVIDSKDKAKLYDRSATEYVQIQEQKANTINEDFQDRIDEVKKTSNRNLSVPPGNKPDGERSTDKDKEEYVSQLNAQSQSALTEMQKAQDDALNAGKTGTGHSPKSPEDLVSFLERGRAKFLSLHKKHVEAIRDGNLVLAHEILKDIHHLLYLYNEVVFHEAYFEPGTAYLPPRPPSTYMESYPGNECLATNRLCMRIINDLVKDPYSQPDEARLKKLLDELNKAPVRK